MNETIQFFAPSRGFASALGLMARQAFSEAFAHLYDPVQFAQFLEKPLGHPARWSTISRILPFAGELRQSADSQSAMSNYLRCSARPGTSARGDRIATNLRP